MLLNVALKHVFHRTRPSFDDPLLTLTDLQLSQRPHGGGDRVLRPAGVLPGAPGADLAARALVALGAVPMVMLVALSRMYIGVHYLSDVLAAAAEGARGWRSASRRLDPAPAPAGAGETSWSERAHRADAAEDLRKPVIVIVNGGRRPRPRRPRRRRAARASSRRGAGRGTGAGQMDGEDNDRAAKSALEQGARLVAAGGGDGTINAVASVMVGSGVPFGVLPLGTLNHFAKDLGIPLDLDEAVRNLATGGRAKVDVGEVNGRIFLNNSSLGLYPDIVRDREKQQRRLGRGKWPAAAVGDAGGAAPLSVPVDAPDGQRRASGAAHAVRLHRQQRYTMQGLAIGERARLDDGVLSLYVAQRPTRLGLLRFAFDALLGRLGSERDFDVLTAPELRHRHAPPHLRVATDGEVTRMTPPLRYRMRPGALTVLVPAVDNGQRQPTITERGTPCAHSSTCPTCISAASTRPCWGPAARADPFASRPTSSWSRAT
jgi:diacylglycerol kinase family enzyme